MAMNPKLMRPKAGGVHPEAAAWRTAVVANGGSVSSTTLAAVNVFCKSVDSAGLRSLFYRLNLFCGGNLSSALVPLYRGPTRTGTQYGNATDTNVNFVSGDYVETGATGGLKGNGTNKRLATAFPTNTLAVADRHLAAYESLNATTDYSGSVQSYSSALNKHWRLGLWTVVSNYVYTAFSGVGGQPTITKATGFLVGQNDSETAGTLYRNGISVANVTGGAATTVDSAAVQVFGEVTGEFSEARLGGYSIGQKFTAPQVLAYYNAMQAFQIALNRAAALTPTFGSTTATADGFTVQISNYDSAYAWAGTATASGVVAISGTGLVTVTGVALGTSSTATITAARTGYITGTATVAATSLAAALTPTFGTPTSTADGFTVQVTNYDATFNWSIDGTGTIVISGSGLITVSTLAAGTSTTVTVGAQKTGYVAGSASITASSLASFSPLAVVLSSGSSYTVPAGATSMKAWAVGSGSIGSLPGGAGGCAYKTYAVSGGSAVTYALGAARAQTTTLAGQATTVTYSGTTITGSGGASSGAGGAFSGGDGGATGGAGAVYYWGTYGQSGGAVGGDRTVASVCGRIRPTDVSGLFAALNAAGFSTTPNCTASPIFGSGGSDEKYGPAYTAGLGGGGVKENSYSTIVGTPSGAGAVVLYFT